MCSVRACVCLRVRGACARVCVRVYVYMFMCVGGLVRKTKDSSGLLTSSSPTSIRLAYSCPCWFATERHQCKSDLNKINKPIVLFARTVIIAYPLVILHRIIIIFIVNCRLLAKIRERAWTLAGGKNISKMAAMYGKHRENR